MGGRVSNVDERPAASPPGSATATTPAGFANAPDPSGTPDDLPKPGDVLLGKFRVERVVGRGGMGVVYATHHTLLDQPMALKLLLTGTRNAEAATRFVNEAKLAARIRSEHVCRVLDVGVLDSGLPYIAMELLSGVDLGDVLERRGALHVPEAVDYMLQALEALAHAHALKIVHRDLKPANLFLTNQPSGIPLLKVLDFGISKSEPFGAASSLTATGAIMGTPYYMSPEQIKDGRAVDARADIWSLGVVLYELLTNTRPFDGDTLGSVFANIFTVTPAPIRAQRADVHPSLEAVVARCLQHDAGLRFSDVSELAAALAPFATADGRHAGRLERIAASLGRVSSPSMPVFPAGAQSSSRLDPPSENRTPARGAPTRVLAIASGLIIGVLFLAAAVAYRARENSAHRARVASAAESASSPAPMPEPTVIAPATASMSVESNTATTTATTTTAASTAPAALLPRPAPSASAVGSTMRPTRRPPKPLSSSDESFLEKRL